MTNFLNVYDINLKKVAILENAHSMNDNSTLNGLNNFSFQLPNIDKKVIFCKTFSFVRFGEVGDYYRIISESNERSDVGTITYTCEHAIGTLIDDLMFGTEQFTNVYSTEVLNYILNKQTIKRWVLGTTDFNFQYEYLFTNENLLNALFSIPKPWTSPYKWVYDFSTYPWKVSIKKINEESSPTYYIRGKKNLLSSNVRTNHADICTRIYPLGYGEEINQLTIKDINNGIPYVQSPDSVIAKYGLISRTFVDRSIEDPYLLKALALANLNILQEPSLENTFNVIDLYPITNNEIDKAEVGDIVKIVDDDIKTYITEVNKVLDDPGNMTIKLSTRSTDVSDMLANMAERQRIESTYAQGSTQLYAQTISENATNQNGAKLSFYIPNEMKQVNSVKCKIELNRFRAFNQQTKGGGQSVQTSSSGGGSVTTSSTGGGANLNTADSLEVYKTSGPSSLSTTLSGGGIPNSTEFGGQDIRVYQAEGLSLTTWHGGGFNISKKTSEANGQIGLHYHNFSISKSDHYHGGVTSKHSHDILGATHAHRIQHQVHSHNMEHTHTVAIPAHKHGVNIPNHNHTINIPQHQHSLTIPMHAHEIEQGIFQYGNPQNAEVFVGGIKRFNMSINGEFDLTSYILNQNGKIPRGQWITIEVKPNDLAYVRINLYIQGFIQSRGGGNY